MNKNVIRAMIYLVCVYLCAWYVLKFSFPEQFALKINNPSIIKFGQYVDSHIALKRFLNTITAFITYWLFFMRRNTQTISFRSVVSNFN